MIHVLSRKASKDEIADMLEELGTYIKLAVDVRECKLAGGGSLHADGEDALLAAGSRQEDIWGADWIPATRQIRYDALINIRPRQGNRSISIGNAAIRKRVEEVILSVFGGQ